MAFMTTWLTDDGLERKLLVGLDGCQSCLNNHMTVTDISASKTHKMAQNRSTLFSVIQTPRKLWSFHRTEGEFWPDFVDFIHDYTQEFYRSYSVFTGKCPRTGKFRCVWS